MKKLEPFFFISFVSLCLIALNGCTKETAFSNEQQLAIEKANALNAAAKPSGGNITVAGGGITLEFGEKTTYEFSAVQSRGKTTGHFILKFRAAGGSLWVDLDCLRLFGDNKATVSGVITKVTVNPNANPDFPPPPFIFVGGRVSFTCQDNGEGGDAPADMVSDIGELPGIPASCADEWPVYLPLDGNVQINK